MYNDYLYVLIVSANQKEAQEKDGVTAVTPHLNQIFFTCIPAPRGNSLMGASPCGCSFLTHSDLFGITQIFSGNAPKASGNKTNDGILSTIRKNSHIRIILLVRTGLSLSVSSSCMGTGLLP